MKFFVIIFFLFFYLFSCKTQKNPIQSDSNQNNFDISDINWKSLNFPLTSSGSSYVFGITANSNNDVFASNNRGQLYCQNYGGTAWVLKKSVGLNHISFIKVNPTNEIFLGYYSTLGSFGSSVLSSDDFGENWSTIYNSQHNCNNLTMFNDTLYIARQGGVVTSSNNGQDWQLLNNDIENMNVMDFVRNHKSGSFFIGTWTDGVFKSIDNGAIWQNNGFETGSIFPLLSTSNGYVFACTGIGLYRTMDDGITWDKLVNGVPEVDILSIASTSDDYLLAGTRDNGLFLSLDNGDEWYNIGLAGIEILSLYTDSEDNVYVGTDSLGVLKSNKQFR